MQNNNTAGQTAIQKFDYEGSPISFANGESVMVNATQMAKKFGKLVKDWLKTQYAKEFLEALSERRKILSADLVIVRKGGTDLTMQGTWMHEDVALEFARWLSPKFAIWCNDRIKELARDGVAVISDDDAMIAHAMRVLQQRLEEKQAQIEAKDSQLRRIIPFADYARTAIECSTATYTMTDTAAFLGFVRVSDFMDWTMQQGILRRLNGRWMPTAEYLGQGYFSTRVFRKVVSRDYFEEVPYTVVTEAGRKMLFDRMTNYTEPAYTLAEPVTLIAEGGAL